MEFAFVAPILFFLVLSMAQFASLMYRQNVLTKAAKEGARVASLPTTTTTAEVVSAVEANLSRGGINPNLASVTVTPTALADAQAGDELQVRVTLPTSQAAWYWVTLIPGGDLSADIFYLRE